jgi:hypothetical protein
LEPSLTAIAEAARQIATGQIATGQIATGQIATGQIATGQIKDDCWTSKNREGSTSFKPDCREFQHV